MVGAYVNHPATPSGLALVQARSLLVCDRAGLRGTAGALVPAVAAWGADASGVLRQFWPGVPQINSFGAGASVAFPGDWRWQRLTWSTSGAAAVSISAHVGSGTPVTVYTGSGGVETEWDWFDTGPQFQPGSAIVYVLTATGSGGTATATITATAPGIPQPTVPMTASAITSSSVHLDWSTGQIVGAVDYHLFWQGPAAGDTTSGGPAKDIVGMASSSTYKFQYAARVRATYTGAVLLTGFAGPYVTVHTLAPAETGPANGVYRIEPSTPATYQWGESGGQSAAWRSTSDDFFHGDGASYGSNRGQQATFFFYARPAAWAGGIGTKHVTRIQIYLARQSGTGISGGTVSRWGAHAYASKPAGAPSIIGASDAGSLAWGGAAWIDLPVSWGAPLVNATYRGFAWGKVAGRYMSADRNPGAGTPNGTILVTVGN